MNPKGKRGEKTKKGTKVVPRKGGRSSSFLWLVPALVLVAGTYLGFRSFIKPGSASSSQTKLSQEASQILTRAELLLNQGEYSQALAAYEQVLARYPRSIQGMTGVGNVHLAQGHGEEALKAYQKALAADPAYSLALHKKGLVLRDHRGDYQGALEAWTKYLQLNPGTPEGAQVRAWTVQLKNTLGIAGVARDRKETRPVLSASLFVGRTQAAYQVAAEMPDLLDSLYCYCYCDRQHGHKTLLTCYTETHAAT